MATGRALLIFGDVRENVQFGDRISGKWRCDNSGGNRSYRIPAEGPSAPRAEGRGRDAGPDGAKRPAADITVPARCDFFGSNFFKLVCGGFPDRGPRSEPSCHYIMPRATSRRVTVARGTHGPLG